MCISTKKLKKSIYSLVLLSGYFSFYNLFIFIYCHCYIYVYIYIYIFHNCIFFHTSIYTYAHKDTYEYKHNCSGFLVYYGKILS